MKILVLGAGGVGGYFGAQLLRSGCDVTFLVRPARKALIDTQGLAVETPRGNFVVRPRTVTADDVTPDHDLIVLTPKAYDLDEALASLSGAWGERAVALPFLNGMDHMDTLDARLGRRRVMGGVAQIAATVTPAGAVRQLSGLHILTVGARDDAHAGLARAFVERCRQAEFDSALADDIEQSLWDKWVFLAALAGMTTLCRGSIGEIASTPFGKALAVSMYDECCRVAEAFGHPIGAAARARALPLLTDAGSSFTASMLRDLQAGRPTEHEHVLGALARRGIAQGLQTPLLQLAHTHMAVQAGARRGG